MTDLNINDLYDDYQANPAAIEIQFYRACESIPLKTRAYALDPNHDCFLEIVNQPQPIGYKFNSLCDSYIEKSIIKGENLDLHPTISVSIKHVLN